MVENEYNRGKVDNEFDFCAVTDPEVKVQLEKAFMKARVSYFLRWEKPGLLARIFTGAKDSIVFCINVAYLEMAEEVIKELDLTDSQVKVLKTKSNNRQGY